MSKDEQIEALEEENYALRQKLSYQSVQEARSHLQNTIREYEHDATGQDGEDAINAAAQGYCDTQDECIRENDPDRWAEMQMGC